MNFAWISPLVMNHVSVQPKTILSQPALSRSHTSHEFKPLHASPIDFLSCAGTIRLPHNLIVAGQKWNLMRCEQSPVKCCCLHLLPRCLAPTIFICASLFFLPAVSSSVWVVLFSSLKSWSQFSVVHSYWSLLSQALDCRVHTNLKVYPDLSTSLWLFKTFPSMLSLHLSLYIAGFVLL